MVAYYKVEKVALYGDTNTVGYFPIRVVANSTERVVLYSPSNYLLSSCILWVLSRVKGSKCSIRSIERYEGINPNVNLMRE